MKDHHHAKPERIKLYEDFSMLLSHVGVLTTPEVRYMLPKYGYSPSTGPTDLIDYNPTAKRVMAKDGVGLAIRKYKNHKIYFNSRMDADAAAIIKPRVDQIKAEIDEVYRRK